MKIPILIIVSCITVSCAHRYDDRLSGTYQVDCDATVQYLMSIPKNARAANPEKLEAAYRKYYSIGRSVTWSKKAYQLTLGDALKPIYESPYTVIESSTNYTVIRSTKEHDPHHAYHIIQYTEDGYWSSFFASDTFKEKYKRIQHPGAR